MNILYPLYHAYFDEGSMKKIQDMTKGNLWGQIFLFGLPLVFSNLLQILFNMSDVAIVGKFAGTAALGAVGSTITFVALFTEFLIGVGCGVMFAGLIFARPLLALLGTKPELISGAELYLRIYFCGMPAMSMYNYGNAVLSAMDETKKPLIFLTIAGIVNVILRVTVPIRTRSNAQKMHIYFVKASYNIPLYYLTAFPCICTFLRIFDLKPNYFFVFQGGTQEYREYFKFRQRRKAEKNRFKAWFV